LQAFAPATGMNILASECNWFISDMQRGRLEFRNQAARNVAQSNVVIKVATQLTGIVTWEE
jgi:hypothetical protein